MKKVFIFTFSFLILALFSSFAPTASNPGSGIQFRSISFDEALALAKKEHKPIFMNVYAVWCGPCTKLKQTTFKSDKVGEAFNRNFINISIDAEKGEGISLARKYEVRAHPLMLIIDENGNVQKRILGLRNDTQLLEDVQAYLK